MTKQTLEQRVAAILTNDNASAAELSELICEAESAAQIADQDAEAERTKGNRSAMTTVNRSQAA